MWHNLPGLKQKQHPCGVRYNGLMSLIPILLNEILITSRRWLADSPADIRDMPHVTCGHCCKCPANNNEPRDSSVQDPYQFFWRTSQLFIKGAKELFRRPVDSPADSPAVSWMGRCRKRKREKERQREKGQGAQLPLEMAPHGLPSPGLPLLATLERQLTGAFSHFFFFNLRFCCFTVM